MVVSESRTELLQWLNATLQLSYTKVEHCGTGAAYCQLMDVIFGGVPMHKVKFDNANTEHDYRNNMKILQAAFNKHGITKAIDTEKLIKCRLQDNLELLQWFRKKWLENENVNDEYDARAMRKDTKVAATPRTASRTSSGSSTINSRRTTLGNIPNGRRVSSTSSISRQLNVVPATPQYSGPGKLQQLSKDLEASNQEIQELSEELKECKILVETLETERNFYFNKLREIEILTQNIADYETLVNLGTTFQGDMEETIANLTVSELTKKLQEIMYTTEEGFDDDMNQDVIDAESF